MAKMGYDEKQRRERQRKDQVYQYAHTTGDAQADLSYNKLKSIYLKNHDGYDYTDEPVHFLPGYEPGSEYFTRNQSTEEEVEDRKHFWDNLKDIDPNTVKNALKGEGAAVGLGTAAAVAGSGLALPLAAAGLATVGLKKFNETEAGKAVNNKIKEWSDASYEKKYTIEDRVADLMKEEPAMTEAEAVDIAKGEGFRDSRGTYAPKNEDGTAMNTLEYIEKEGKQKFGISDEELDMAKKVVYSQMSDKVRTNQANGGRVEKERYEKLAGGYEGIDEFNQYLDDLGQTGEGRTKRSVLMQYAKAMVNSELADKEREELTNAVNDNGNDKRNGFAKAVNDVGLDAVSVGMNLVGGVSNAIGNATSAIRLGDRSMPTDVNNRLGRFSQQAQDIRNARTEEIENYFNNETVGNIAKFGYGATMSAVDSGVAALTGSEALTLGIMASNSYDSALKEAQDKGLTEEQSRDLAFVSGVTEILTEKIGLDNLYSMSKKPIKSVLKETLIQAGFEGSEEVAGDIINEIADRIIAGDRSEYEKAKAEGMSDAEYIKQFAMQLGLDFVAGAWGGALHGGVVAGNQMIKSGKNYKNKGDIANNQKSLEVMDDIAKVNEAVGQKYAEVKEFGDKLAAKEAAGQKVTLDEKATYDAKQSELFQTLNEEGITYKDVEEGRKTKIETPEEFKVNNTNKLNSEDAYRSMANATTPAELVEAYEMSDKSEVNTGAYKNFKSRMLNNGYDVAQFDTAERITNTEDAYKQGYVDAENGMFNQSNALTGKTQIAYNQGVIDARTKQAENTLKSEGEFTPKVTVGGKEANIDIQSDPITFKGDTAVVNVNGNEVKPTDIEFANETTAKLFTYAASMDNEATANAALKFYPGNMSVDMYKRAFSYAHNQGMLNVPFENIVKNKPFFVDALGEKNIKAIYEIGKEATKDEKPSSKEVKSVARKGTGKVEYDLTNKKIGKSQTALIEFLAKKMSVDVTVTDDNVKSMGANGFFNAVTGKVVLNVNKGNMFGTLFHEIAGEYAEAFNSKEMVAFQNDLLNWYYTVMNPQSLESIIKNYQSVYQNSGHNNQSNKTFREAADEMLNDALAGLFENERTMDKFASWLIDENGVEEATKEINTFADLVKKIADSIRSLALGSKKNIGQMMLSNTKDADKLMDQFLKVLDGAIANYNNIEVSDSANSQEQFSVDIESAKPGTEILDKDGNLAAIVGENGEVAFSLNTSDYTKGVLNKYLDKMVKSGQLSKQDADDIISSYEVIEDYTRELVESGDYEEFSDWQMEDAFTDDAKALTCIVKNGEYPLNLDWSTICKKRLPFNTVMSRLVKMSDFNVAGLSPQDIVEINDIIKNRGFEVACKLCFVESRRYNTPSWARSFVNPWNALVDAAANGEKVGELDFRNADYSNLSSFTPNWKAVEKKALELSEEAGFKPTKNHPSPIKPIYEKMIRLMKSDSKALNHLNTNDFINSEGMDRMLNDYKKLYKIVFGHGGQSKPKIVHSESRYRSEILKGRSFSKAKSDYIGGVRLQSFSDFRANLYFDYVQAYSELAAKSLRLQSYSKEPAYAKLFGLTGAKINMSLLGNVDSKTKEQIDKAFPDGFGGADKETNELLRRVGLDANGNYVQNDESFPWEEAFKLQSNDEYSKNVGTILVGLSYEHIKKAMDDDQIRMVIPYHASGIPGAVASRTNVAYYTDYTQYQHEKQLVGDKKYKFNYYIALEECEKLAKKGKFAWDDVPKKAAEMLVRECEKNGYAPRFPQFAYNITDGSTTVTYKNGMPDNVEKDSNNVPLINKNYYKLIEDFTMYDNNGHYAPQKEVRMNFPTTINSGVEVKSVGMDGKELSFKEYLGAIIDDQHKSNAMLTDNMQDMIDEIMEKLNDSESESVVFSLDVDTLGNTLSSEQKEYFKDSKVVDSNGALKVMYHGTPNSGFTVFDPKESDDMLSLFFTDNKDVADSYSGSGDSDLKPIFSNYNGSEREANADFYNRLWDSGNDSYAYEYGVRKNKGRWEIVGLRYENKDNYEDDEDVSYSDYLKKYHSADALFSANSYLELLKKFEDEVVHTPLAVGNYAVYLNVTNPLHVYNPSGKNMMWYDTTGFSSNHADYENTIRNGASKSELENEKHTTRDWAEKAFNEGYDGVIFHNIYDIGNNSNQWNNEASTVVVAFNSNQIKLVDNLKPTDNADIRFSIDNDFWDAMDMSEEEAALIFGEEYVNTTEEVASIIEEGAKSLEKVKVDRQLVENIAKRIVRSHQSTYSPTTLADNLEKLFAYFDELGGTVNYIDIQRIASEIARPVVMDSTVTDDVATQMYKDFRDVVRSYPIKLTEDQKNEIKGLGISLKGFGFGMLNLSSEGSYTDDIWSELQDRAREIGYILPDATDLDQPLALLDALEGLKNSQTRTLDENGMGIDEESKALGMEIIKDYFQAQNGGATNQTVEELKKAISDYKNNVESIYADRLERAKKELEDAIKKDKEKLKDAKDTIKYQKELIAIYKTNASIRSRYEHKEALTKGRATDRVKKVANKLITMLTSPTDKKHVPDVLRKPVAEFLDTIDFVSHRASAESKESAKWQDKMNDLSRLLGKIKSLEEEDTDGVVSNLSEALDEDLIDSMELFVKNYGNKSSLSRLDGEGTKELARILEGLYTQINNTNKLYENRYNQDAISLCIMSHVELAEMKERVDKTGVGKVLKNFFNADLLDSISYFNALGKHANSILDELKEGYKHKYRRVNQTQKWFNNMLKELKINDKVLKNWTGKHANATTFKLAEGDITLTTGQIMSLYNHLQREQSREHIFVGGIKASLEEGKGRHQAQIKPIHAKSNELQMIIDTLTDDQKAVAQKMQWYLSNVCSSWGNNVTKKAYGYTKFTEEHYWPIKSNSNSIATNDKNTNDTVAMRGLEHSGCTKNLTPHSTNAIEIRDAFDVFTEHSVFMASYEGLVLPIKDALKWFNYSPKTVGADQDDIDNPYGQRRYEISIKEDIERIMGTRGQKWFVKFMRDINGDAKGSGTVELISKFSGFMKASSVGGNLRVAIQQPTAYVRALNVLPPSTLVEAMAVNPFKYSEKAKSKSSWAWIKGEGYYDTFLGKSMKEIITNQATTTDKVKDYMNILSQYGDDLTWGVLYHAAEIQVKKDNKGIDVNSKEFTEKVVELFDSVIDQTQVVDTVFHRSDLMRHKEADMLTAFMMEPSKSYNMIYRALGSGDKKKIARALLTFVLNAIFVSAAAGLVDRMRNDDNEHSGMDIYLQAVIGRDPETGKIPVGDFLQSNLGDNLNPLNIVPVFKEIVSAFEGYDPSRMDVSVIYDSVKSSKKIYSNLEKLAAGDEMQKTPYGMYYECAKVISEMTGIPISSASRDIVGIYNTINNNWDGKNISKDNEYYKNGSQYGSFDRAFDNGDFETVKTFINNKKAEDPDDLPNVTKHLTSTYKPKLIELKEQGKTDEYNQLYNRLVECYVLTNSGKRDKTDAEKRKSAKEKIADWFE